MQTSILIIEDEPSISDVLACALKSEGFATQCCKLGCFDVCRLARKFTDIPILFLSARSEECIVGLKTSERGDVEQPLQRRRRGQARSFGEPDYL